MGSHLYFYFKIVIIGRPALLVIFSSRRRQRVAVPEQTSQTASPLSVAVPILYCHYNRKHNLLRVKQLFLHS